MTTTTTTPKRSADWWRGVAKSFADRASQLLDSGTSRQRPTRRRDQIVASQIEEAKRLHAAGERAAALAAATDAGTVPPLLVGLMYGKDIEELCSAHRLQNARGARLENRGIDSSQALAAAAALFELPVVVERNAKQDAAELMQELKRFGMQDIPGFFPTPPSIAQLVCRAADFGPDIKTILEPSCGAGCLLIEAAKFAREAGADPQVFGIEINRELANFATRRTSGDPMIQIHNVDFMDNPVDERSVDLVVMNPPFENGQDIQQIARAFQWLRPGGRLVAIMCNGPLFRSDSRSVKFREWLVMLNAWTMKLPADAFDRTDAVRRTGVQTVLLVIDRPHNT